VQDSISLEVLTLSGKALALLRLEAILSGVKKELLRLKLMK